MTVNVASGIETHSGRSADRRLGVDARKSDSPCSERINIWRLKKWVARTTEIIEPQLVEHNEQDVSYGSHFQATTLMSRRASASEIVKAPMPPSRFMSAPLIQELDADNRNTAASATSR